jgi:lipoate-protein ligase A
MRFIVDPPMTGAENMARDLALLAEGLPTCRLYAWKPACVSLGYAQPESDVDRSVLEEHGMDLVRRPTGGGAILHDVDEVTYGVVLPRSMAPPDLFGSYRFIANGVVETLRELGLGAGFVEGHTGREPLCYLREEGVSVAVQGRKISGGAQKRTKTHLLQHGTILLSRRTGLLAELFRTEPERIDAHVACLQDHLPSLTREDVLQAAKVGFARALSVPLPTQV